MNETPIFNDLLSPFPSAGFNFDLEEVVVLKQMNKIRSDLYRRQNRLTFLFLR